MAVGAVLQGAVGPGELAAEHMLTGDREWPGEGAGARSGHQRNPWVYEEMNSMPA